VTVKFLAPAGSELTEAIDYYDSQELGLGAQFAEEVKRALERILQYPSLGAPLQENPPLQNEQVPLWNHLSGEG